MIFIWIDDILLYLFSRFRFVLSPNPTPANLFLGRRLKWADKEQISKLDQIEVCPQAMELTESMAERISCDGGGALIIDYGLDGVISDSLQVKLFQHTSFYLASELAESSTWMLLVESVNACFVA